MDEPTAAGTGERARRANRLYWESDRSVTRIAEDLGVSKGTLYGLVDPLPAGLPCPECTSEMVYANRTARDRGLLACPGCGLVEEERLIREAWRGTAMDSPSGAVVVRSRPAESQERLEARRPRADASRALLGMAFLGAAAGVFLVIWSRRR